MCAWASNGFISLQSVVNPMMTSQFQAAARCQCSQPRVIIAEAQGEHASLLQTSARCMHEQCRVFARQAS